MKMKVNPIKPQTRVFVETPLRIHELLCQSFSSRDQAGFDIECHRSDRKLFRRLEAEGQPCRWGVMFKDGTRILFSAFVLASYMNEFGTHVIAELVSTDVPKVLEKDA